MAYIYDPDLEFLSRVKSEDLNNLANILLFGSEQDVKDKNYRFTEELSINKDFKDFYPDHSKYWSAIASEIQCFGGNSFANVIRGGKGVVYREILIKVFSKYKVKFDDSLSTHDNEDLLIISVMEKAFANMSEEDKKVFLDEIGVDREELVKYSTISTQVALKLFISLVKMGGFRSYTTILQISNIIARTITGAGLKFATNNAITFYLGRAVSSRFVGVITGPIGLAVTSIWSLWDLAGPATRVTAPTVLEIIGLRRMHLLASSNN